MYDGLPKSCFSILPSEGKLIYIKRGEMGYYPSNWDTGVAENNRRLADYHNEKNAVTKAAEEAMLVGSMFDWDVPGANPKQNEQAVPEINAGYAITQRTTIGEIEIVLGESIAASDKYVTWRCTPTHERNETPDYYWGHYVTTKDAAITDYNCRITEENNNRQEYVEGKSGVKINKRSELER